MGTADDLLDLMFEWIKEAEECSSNLRALAEELESLREKYNAVGTVSSTVAAATTVMSFIAAPFTGGASLLVGGVVGAIGAGVSAVTKLIETFESSDKMKKVQSIDKRCNHITMRMQSLYRQLRGECPGQHRCQNDEDKHVVKEFLKAIIRRSKLDVGLDTHFLEEFVRDVIEDILYKTFTGSPLNMLVIEVMGVLTAFSLKLGGSVLPTIAAAGGVQIGKAVIGTGASAALLGVVGLGINLYESITNWKELISNNHETDASRSLRDTAKKIDKTRTKLSDKLSGIEKMLREAIQNYQPSKPPQKTSQPKTSSKSTDSSCNATGTSSKGQGTSGGAAAAPAPPDPPRDPPKKKPLACDVEFESSSEVEEVLKMALQNFRSLNKILPGRNPKFSSDILRDLLQRNNLDVILITETWIKTENLPADVVRRLLPENYSIFLVPRPLDHGKSGGGGVAIVHRNDVACEPMSFQRTTTFEYVATAITTSRSIEPLLVLNIYRPPEGTVAEFVESFLSEFESLLSEAYDRFTHVVIGGDFNIWVDSLETKAKKFEETRVGNELIQHVSQSTHIRGRILDLILAKSNVTITIVSVDDNDFSDHSTVIFIAKLRLKKNKSKHFKKSE